MATRLEDLLHSLATLLIRYHDAQKVKRIIEDADPKKTRAYAIKILHDPDIKFEERFKPIINTFEKIYKERKPFLDFLLNEIIYLKDVLNRKKSFSFEEEGLLKKHLYQMLMDFRQLMLTPNNKKHRVTYSPTKSEEDRDDKDTLLLGMINTARVGRFFCTSGDLINEEILLRLTLGMSDKTTPSNEEVFAIIESLFEEHQNKLVIKELQHEAEKVTDADKLAQAQAEKLADATKLVTVQAAKLADVDKFVQEQAAKLADADKLTKTLTERLIEADKRNSEQAQTIKDNAAKIDEIAKQLKVSQLSARDDLGIAPPRILGRGTLTSPFNYTFFNPLLNGEHSAAPRNLSPLGIGPSAPAPVQETAAYPSDFPIPFS